MGLLSLLTCTAGIYVCFLSWGGFQESLTTTAYGVDEEGKKQRFDYFLFMNLTQSVIACICAAFYAHQRVIDLSPGNLSWDLKRLYFFVGVTSSLASPFGYASLKYINFPTMTLSKSCKLVPVMAVQVLIYRKRYPLYKYLSVGLITLGVFLFFMLQPSKGADFASNSLKGVVLVILNLLLDGFTNSTEDVIFKNHKVNSTQLMFYLNMSQSILLALYLLNPFNPELASALHFLSTYPQALKDLFLFSLAGAVGQTMIFFTLERFGSLTLVTITVTRKLFSIILSVLTFGHAINLGQWACVLVVFAGIGLESFLKEKVHHVHGHHGHGHGQPKPAPGVKDGSKKD